MSITRREFVQWGSLSGAALFLGVSAEERVFAFEPSAAPFAPNQWLRIGADDSVVVVAHKSEMGQGVRTALPMILADELGADWNRIVIEHARPGPSFQNMNTSGSGSVSGSWRPLRLAAAAAREMLIDAGASDWNVDRSTCAAENGAVVHRPTARRLTFGALAERASRLPVPATPRLKDPSEFRLIGTRVRRVDSGAFVRGTAEFGIDKRVPGMRFATVMRAPAHGGRARRWDDERVRRSPGVVAVVPISTGVAIVADSTWAALRARRELEVEWEMGVGATGDSAEYWRALESALQRGGKSARRAGNAVDAIASASRRMEATYRAPFQAHAAMEPLSCVADVRDGRCEIWAGLQSPNRAQPAIATLLGIAQENVTINVMLLGGAFGRRIAFDYIVEAVEVSRAIRAPVQVVWSREDDIRHDMYQAAQINHLAAGLDATGKPTAWRHRVADFHLSMFGAFDPNDDPAASGNPWGGHDTPYAFPAIDVELAVVPAPVPTGAWRAVTYPAAVFARECFLDEIAHATGKDPVQLRLDLLPSPGTEPWGSNTLDNGDRLRRVVQLVAERAGWGTPLPSRSDGRRWGRGIACNGYHRRTMVAQVAEVSVGPRGDVRVHRVVSAVDCGQVVNRSGLEAQFEGGIVWALSAALKTEITFEGGRTRQSNFNDFPVLRMRETPAVELHIVPSSLGPFGIGEQPVPAVAPAVFNAVFAATGKRIRHMPLRATDLTDR